jgi:structural maintenance of chromosome 4
MTRLNDNDDVQLEKYSEDKLSMMDSAILEREIKQLLGSYTKSFSYFILNVLWVDQTSKMKPNLSALAEYRQKLEIYLQRAKDVEEITAKRDSARQLYDDLRKRRLDEFMDGFTAISQKLKEMYQVHESICKSMSMLNII